MFDTRFWWPLELSDRERQACESFGERMRTAPPALDVEKIQSVSAELARIMAQHVGDVIERDGLPHLCHIINGWGNARFRGRRLVEHLQGFIHRDGAGRPLLLQCDPEGDFHPWQTFAYAVMAGVDPDETLPGTSTTLRELAKNSRALNTGKGQELGHLLFALSFLDPDPDGRPFHFDGELKTLSELMDIAVDAHHNATFEVCRKFHLTEGLCAVSTLIPGMESYREAAQGFLEGQLDMLLLLGTILDEAAKLEAAGQRAEEGSLIQELRETLVMQEYLENHCYYAGHLVELAAFADALGFEILPEHRGAIAFVINELNSIIPEFLPHTTFLRCFLHFGHYRRAMTLLPEVDRLRAEGRALERSDLTRFTVDFDAQPPYVPAAGPSPVEKGIYKLAPPEEGPRPRFEEIVALYAATAPAGFDPRGKFNHFRRIGPPAWPRAFHYELLDYGKGVGAEIHLESESVAVLGERVRALTERVARRLPGRKVEWDPSWWRSRGRLRVYFPDDEASPREVAEGVRALIEETRWELDGPASGLAIEPAEASLALQHA